MNALLRFGVLDTKHSGVRSAVVKSISNDIS